MWKFPLSNCPLTNLPSYIGIFSTFDGGIKSDGTLKRWDFEAMGLKSDRTEAVGILNTLRHISRYSNIYTQQWWHRFFWHLLAHFFMNTFQPITLLTSTSNFHFWYAEINCEKPKFIMKVEKLKKNSGQIYLCNGHVYVSNGVKKKLGIRSLKCFNKLCKGTATMKSDELKENVILNIRWTGWIHHI